MVRDAHDALSGDAVVPPPMLRQPAEPPPPLDPVAGTDGVTTFRRVWADRNAGASRSFRNWAGRVSGRADRRLLLAVAGATDAVVTQCDQLAARLASQGAVTADVATSFGSELTLLRAEVVRLQRAVDALRAADS